MYFTKKVILNNYLQKETRVQPTDLSVGYICIFLIEHLYGNKSMLLLKQIFEMLRLKPDTDPVETHSNLMCFINGQFYYKSTVTLRY